MVGWKRGSSLHRFHFFDGIVPGQWYPEGFLARKKKHGIEMAHLEAVTYPT